MDVSEPSAELATVLSWAIAPGFRTCQCACAAHVIQAGLVEKVIIKISKGAIYE